MALSDRIRPDCEAAPWVINEVKEMESRIQFWIEKSTTQAIQISGMETEIGKLEAENAQLKEEKKQWEPEWFSQAEANAAGYNQALGEIKKLEAENARYREALQVYADDDVIGTVARKALKGE